MNNLKSYENFNEGVFTDFIDKIGSLLFGPSKELKTNYTSLLRKYDIEGKESIAGDRVQLFHKGRLIADIQRDRKATNPRWTAKFFYYDSEYRMDPNRNYLQLPQIPGQTEQPYTYKQGTSNASDANSAIKWVVDIWSRETESGIAKNPIFQAKSGLGKGDMIDSPRKIHRSLDLPKQKHF